MRLAVKEQTLHRIDLTTRMPFRYGIAVMTALPHVVLRTVIETDNGIARGWSAEQLPPKWFTKVPDKDPEEEIDEMISVVLHAMKLGEGLQVDSVFDFWCRCRQGQAEWGRETGFPPLLTHFGVSLTERAVIDAVCRKSGVPFHRLVKENGLGMDLGALHSELAGASPGDLLPASPLERILVRHTVGLADPLSAADLDEHDRLQDGLPQTLEDSIRAYGLSEFKIKICGDLDTDEPRLNALADVLEHETGGNYGFSLDGNEQYETAADFLAAWEQLMSRVDRPSFWKRLSFVEQPVHRDYTFASSLPVLRDPAGRAVPVIIDEADGEVESLPRALELGYSGVSHKNCKGVCKGIANRCLLTHRASPAGGPEYIMTGEDLAGIGPIGLPQDLAVQAALGNASVERNGHHYFAGLSQMPAPLQAIALETMPDLYEVSDLAWPRLKIRDGLIDVRGLNAAPFGVPFEPDLSAGFQVAGSVGWAGG